LAECLCAPGFFYGSVPMTVTSFVNVARACGAAQNAACPALLPQAGGGYAAATGNDNLFSLMTYSFGTATTGNPLYFRIDFQTSRTLSHIIFYNRPTDNDRANGVQIQVGDDDLFNNNPVCATLNSDVQQTRTCSATGRYIFIVIPVSAVTVLNFVELQAFVAVENIVPNQFQDMCTPCAAGSFKGHVGNEACAPCPVDTYCPAQSVAPVPCVENSSRLEVGGKSLQDCLCRPGFLTNNSVSHVPGVPCRHLQRQLQSKQLHGLPRRHRQRATSRRRRGRLHRVRRQRRGAGGLERRDGVRVQPRLCGRARRGVRAVRGGQIPQQRVAAYMPRVPREHLQCQAFCG